MAFVVGVHLQAEPSESQQKAVMKGDRNGANVPMQEARGVVAASSEPISGLP